MWRHLACGALVPALTGCITSYNVRPEIAWEAAPGRQAQYSETIYFHIPNLTRASLASLAGDPEALRESFLRNHPFARAEAVTKPPQTGQFVDVLVMTRDGSGVGLIWSYVSSAFLFVLPAYFGSSGYTVKYRVFTDGTLQRTFEYEIDRKVFAWLPLLPFLWINALTDSEVDAFEATTRRFFEEAAAERLFDSPGRIETGR